MKLEKMKLAYKNFRFPAEFEPQEAIWLGWPVYENKKGISPIPVYLEIIKTLTVTVKVNVAVQNEQEAQQVREILEKDNVDLKKVSLYSIPHDDVWFRDVGPIFLTNNSNELIVYQFGFNGWGYEAIDSTSIILDQNVAKEVANLDDLDLFSTDLISEGGDREFNGRGTMMVTAAVEKQRNPELSLDQIEEEFKRIFNLEKVIWLNKGIYDDDLAFEGALPGPDGLKDILTCIATGGHIDEYCRFVSEDTILLAEVSEEEAKINPISRVSRERLEENFKILINSTDQDGKPFKIKRIPLPESMYLTFKAGDGVYDYYYEKYSAGFVIPIGSEIKAISASSYNNFLITNGAVLAPKYWKPGLSESIKEKDEIAHAILQELFPDRELHTFDVMALNIGGGGIHCITQQEPKSKLNNSKD